MASDPASMSAGLRIGDAERERAAQSLGEHLRAGRLEMAEYDERLERAYAARTANDVVPLFADLPGGSPLGPHGFESHGFESHGFGSHGFGSGDLVPPPPRIHPSRNRRPGFSALALPIRAVLVLALLGAAIVLTVFLTFPPLFLLPLLWFTFGRRFARHGYYQRGYRRGYDHRYHGSAY
jgi:hypothetical protein